MSVTVVDGGKSTVIKTRTSDVQSLLEESKIAVGPYDQISQPLNADLNNGSTIVIERAKGITLIADGMSKAEFTTARTVREALANLNVTLDTDDKLYPDPDTAVYDGMKIRVVRVEKKVFEAKYPVEFTVEKKNDASLLQGKLKQVQAGKEGLIVKKFEKVYEDGRLVSDRMVSKEVAQAAVPKIVAVGTKKKPAVTTLSYDPKAEASADQKTLQVNGQSVKVKKVLTNVTLTAYTAGPESTGKDKGDPGYGITASGTKVSEGRTISVDPDVIPLGWWVYIEGIGFRRAEDTGSAIKGKKIDVYYDSLSYANKFGKKRGHTVYLIGPTKPSSV
ncbi:ubiquitin-like domain-containing protein [Cohnella lubricantis]|nr:ubiquitin-like domain-containing protein [Cohnella lubricantis]